MPVIIDGTNGVSTPNTFAFKNRIINGGFTINQRGYVTNTSLTSGSYGHDRWKGGASNGTYTFTQASAGVNTTITITAGSIIQVIEGANLPEGGTYVLSWTGTAQGKIGAGSFGASGITGTITAGTNTNIEFNTGTCGNVQLEVGSTATSFDYRSYGTELALCQRYYVRLGSPFNTITAGSRLATGTCTTASACAIPNYMPVSMRSAPTVGFSSINIANVSNDTALTSVSGVVQLNSLITADYNTGGGMSGLGQIKATGSAAFIDYSSEL